MSVVVAPANTITLTVDSQSIECQVTSHNLDWADPASGDITRTGCGDEVTIPADSTQVGTLDLTLFDDRTLTGFGVWTRQHHGESADFVLVEHFDVDGTDTAVEYSGAVIVKALPVSQTAYAKIETVSVTWAVTEFVNIGVTPTP